MLNPIALDAQDNLLSIPRNVVFVEIGGSAIYSSLNYERLFITTEKVKIGGRIGVSTYRLTDFALNFNPDIFLPFGLNALYGKKNSLLFGVGQVIANTVSAGSSDYKPKRNTMVHASFNIGYAYQKIEEGIIFRISYSPVVENYKNFKHWFAVSFGYLF